MLAKLSIASPEVASKPTLSRTRAMLRRRPFLANSSVLIGRGGASDRVATSFDSVAEERDDVLCLLVWGVSS